MSINGSGNWGHIQNLPPNRGPRGRGGLGHLHFFCCLLLGRKEGLDWVGLGWIGLDYWTMDLALKGGGTQLFTFTWYAIVTSGLCVDGIIRLGIRTSWLLDGWQMLSNAWHGMAPLAGWSERGARSSTRTLVSTNQSINALASDVRD